MAYNPNIPQADELLSQSQPEIQENFSQNNALIAINHISFGLANSGKHLYLQIPNNAAPVTAIAESGLSANVGVKSGVSELVFTRENNGVSIPFTEGLLATSGWSRLPSGLILKWGITGALTDNVDNIFLFPVGGNIQAFATAYSVNVSMIGNNASDSNGNWDLFVSGLTNLQFTIYVNTNKTHTRQFYYWAVGV